VKLAATTKSRLTYNLFLGSSFVRKAINKIINATTPIITAQPNTVIEDDEPVVYEGSIGISVF
jgi:hypothetical protein